MEKKITGTMITLAYSNNKSGADTKGLQSLVNGIENKVIDKEGLKVITNTTFGKGNMVHHHILINRKVEIDLKDKWENGQASLDA